jgi:hypothetical protein
MIKVNVEEGEILVNSVWVSLETPSLIIIELDTKSKYPNIACHSSNEISLYADEHTLYASPELEGKTTNVIMELPEGFCVGATSLGRYTVQIYCYNENHQQKQEGYKIWETSRCHQHGLCVSEPETLDELSTTCDACPRKK